jgi:hypothetical protein
VTESNPKMDHHPHPARVRPGLQKVLALLVVTPSLAEVLAEAERLDLRDLSEHEISWLEGVSVRTVRDWRLRGTGPNYRHGGGVRYPIRWYLEWREANRQGAAAQRPSRRRSNLGEAG